MKKPIPKYGDGTRLQKRADKQKAKSQSSEDAAKRADTRIGVTKELKGKLSDPPGFYDRNIKRLEFRKGQAMESSGNQASRAIRLEGKAMTQMRKAEMPSSTGASVRSGSFPKMKGQKQQSQDVPPVTTGGNSGASPEAIGSTSPGSGGQGTPPVGAQAPESFAADRVAALNKKYPNVDFSNVVRGRGTQDLQGVFPRTRFENVKVKRGKLTPLWKGEGAAKQADTKAPAGEGNTGALHQTMMNTLGRKSGGVNFGGAGFKPSFKGGAVNSSSSATTTAQPGSNQPQQQPAAGKSGYGATSGINRGREFTQSAAKYGAPQEKQKGKQVIPGEGSVKRHSGLGDVMERVAAFPVTGGMDMTGYPKAGQQKIAPPDPGSGLEESAYDAASEKDLITEINRLGKYNLALPMGGSAERKNTGQRINRIHSIVQQRGYSIGYSSQKGSFLRDPRSGSEISLGE